MKELTKEQIDVLEKLDWSVSSYTDDGRVEIGKYSPLEDAEAIQQMLDELADALEGKEPAITDKEAQNREELFRLMQAHPDLPIVPMVDSEIVADDCCSWWVGHWGYATVTEYVMGDERIFFKDDDEDAVLDGIEEYRSVWEDWPDEKITETFNSLPWVKCIVVYITT